jgi:hypothetical protein
LIITEILDNVVKNNFNEFALVVRFFLCDNLLKKCGVKRLQPNVFHGLRGEGLVRQRIRQWADDSGFGYFVSRQFAIAIIHTLKKQTPHE